MLPIPPRVNAVMYEDGRLQLIEGNERIPYEGDPYTQAITAMASQSFAGRYNRCKIAGHLQAECRNKMNQDIECYSCGKLPTSYPRLEKKSTSLFQEGNRTTRLK